MDTETASFLIDLNRKFYENFAEQFSATRQRLQPGVHRVISEYLDTAPKGVKVLDLGCGNGELAHELAQREFSGTYIGLDFSEGLLEEASRNLPLSIEAFFYQVDLTSPDWITGTAGKNLQNIAPFDYILSFAVLHHLPGRGFQRQVIQNADQLLGQQGLFILSVWQFLNSARLRERIQPWQEVGLDPEAVDSGDYLLDWRRGGKGFRYVHHFSPEELSELATQTGFQIINSFISDGEGGNLGLYQVWKKA